MPDHAAFDDGYDAYWEGIDLEDNPYDEAREADQRKSWDEGWREARKHDYDERDG